MQRLDTWADSIQHLLVDTAQTPYGRQPIPNHVDEGISSFLEAYLSARPSDQEQASLKIGRDSFGAESLTVYAKRAAALAVRTNDSHYLQLAVVAMKLAATGADDQEFTWTLPVLYDAAARLSPEPEKIFASVIGTGPSANRVMQIFRWKADQRMLKHDQPITGPDGFRYEPILGG